MLAHTAVVPEQRKPHTLHTASRLKHDAYVCVRRQHCWINTPCWVSRLQNMHGELQHTGVGKNTLYENTDLQRTTASRKTLHRNGYFSLGRCCHTLSPEKHTRNSHENCRYSAEAVRRMWYQADTRWQQPFREKEPRLRRRSTPKECAIEEPAGRNSSPNLHTLLHRAHDVHTQQ